LKPAFGCSEFHEFQRRYLIMQRILRSAGLLVVPVIMACGVAAHADQWDKLTKITVNGAIEVPGAVLPAGTYVFKLLNSASNRNIVQVMNNRQTHVFATILAVPNYQMEPTGKTVISFYEVPAGQPQPVRAWFYPGDNYGQEFVYGKHRVDIAQVNPAPAPSPVVETPQEPAPVVAEVQPAPEPAPVETAPEAVIIAANEPPAPAPYQPAPAAPVMPQTASNLPLFALLGFLSIGAVLALGTFTKRLD
jgi:outer membrane biosynthesis protein TonB